MSDEIKLEPDKQRLAAMLRSPTPPSLYEFYGAMSPKTHGQDFAEMGHPDAVDNFLNMVGVTTDRVAKFRQAHVVEQQLEPIYRAVIAKRLGEVTETPTVGEAQQLVPGMPVPEAAITRGSTAAPFSLVPSNQTPSGQPDWDISHIQHDPFTDAPASHRYAGNANAGGPAGDFPLSPEHLGKAGPTFYSSPGEGVSQVPTQTVDKDMLLTPPFKELFDRKMHQAGLRPIATNGKLEAMNLYESIRSGEIQESYPGQADELGAFLGVTQKQYAPGDPRNVINKNRATITGAQADRADETVDANLRNKESGTNLNDAKTEEIKLLQDAKLKKLEAQTSLAYKQAALAKDQGAMERARERIFKLQTFKTLSSLGELTHEETTAFFESMLKGTDLSATSEDPSYWNKLGMGSPGTKIIPRPGVQPGSKAPALAPPPGTGPMDQETSQAPPADKKTQAKALFDRMKEGEVQIFDGAKYRKKAGKLVPE